MMHLEGILKDLLKSIEINRPEDCAEKLAKEITKYYEVFPGTSGKIASKLQQISEELFNMQQSWTLDAGDRLTILGDELLSIASYEGLAFEEVQRIRFLKMKQEYLKKQYDKRIFRDRLLTLESALKDKVKDDAWEIYLDIEELKRECQPPAN